MSIALGTHTIYIPSTLEECSTCGPTLFANTGHGSKARHTWARNSVRLWSQSHVSLLCMPKLIHGIARYVYSASLVWAACIYATICVSLWMSFYFSLFRCCGVDGGRMVQQAALVKIWNKSSATFLGWTWPQRTWVLQVWYMCGVCNSPLFIYIRVRCICLYRPWWANHRSCLVLEFTQSAEPPKIPSWPPD